MDKKAGFVIIGLDSSKEDINSGDIGKFCYISSPSSSNTTNRPRKGDFNRFWRYTENGKKGHLAKYSIEIKEGGIYNMIPKNKHNIG